MNSFVDSRRQRHNPSYDFLRLEGLETEFNIMINSYWVAGLTRGLSLRLEDFSPEVETSERFERESEWREPKASSAKHKTDHDRPLFPWRAWRRRLALR